MAKIDFGGDPTLDAYNAQIVASQQSYYRPYLGMSEIGEECARKLWYRFRWCALPAFDATTLKRFADGHASEDVVVRRLQDIPGVECLALDPVTGEQFGFSDHDGHFRGHMDGVILGLLQAPKTWHVLEIKCSAKIGELDKAKASVGEKMALEKWNATYYAQAVLYMDYADLDRHYLVCCDPGARNETSVRTDCNKTAAKQLRRKALKVITAQNPPTGISENPDFYKCRSCDFSGICHGGDMVDTNCRTCLHSTPAKEGQWHCARWDKIISTDEQKQSCPVHLFIPSLIPGEQIDAGTDWVQYKMKDGSDWIDGTPA